MQFEAEIKTTGSRKLVSNDIEYKVVFTSNNPEVLTLGAIDPQTTVKVTVEPYA
jgi:hypothetical protein